MDKTTRSPQVVWIIVREVMTIVGVGLAAGIGLSPVAMRGLTVLLYQVSVGDPATLLGVTVVLAAVAFSATWMPAWRAAHVDPLVALRHD